MSLVGLVNLAERLLNQNSTQGQDPAAQQKAANPQTTAAQGTAEDLFTPSAQNGQTQATAQDAGLFSVAQFTFFSAAADFLLGQGTAPAAPAPVGAGNGGGNAGNGNAAQTAFVTPPTTPALAGLIQPNANTTNTTPVVATNQGFGALANAANTAAAAPAPAAGAATNANGAATTAPAGSLTVQQQLQALNTALAALGLDPQQIQQLDQIASVINDFNPNAFTSLAYQLEELAQQAAQPAATNTNATQNANVPTTNAGNTNGANAAAGGFQLQELVIKFAGVQAQATAGGNGNGAQATAGNGGTGNNGPSGGNGTVTLNAFNLQIEEVNLTLVNGNGQATQIQAPAANGQQPAAAVKARAANA